MQVQENISLKRYNTFGIDVNAKYFSSFANADELNFLTTLYPGEAHFILGGGSNILFANNFDGFVLKNEIVGIEKIGEDEEYIYVKAGAGVNWHQFVLHCIKNNWAGVENLSLIPGNVGASPMQNIGAYGVEIENIFFALAAFHLREKKIISFTKEDCAFGYRESVFKHKYKNQFAILHVTYKLRKQPVFNTTYGAIQQELEKMGVKELSIQAISEAVIKIRSSKLPNPQQIGNAGSFFKNPEVPLAQYNELKLLFPGIIAYKLENGNMKLAAGWLIEQCGWKGFRRGNTGCYDKQALVLVNYGHASGREIVNLSEEIMQSVKEKFSVQLEREVNII